MKRWKSFVWLVLKRVEKKFMKRKEKKLDERLTFGHLPNFLLNILYHRFVDHLEDNFDHLEVKVQSFV